MSVDSQGWGCRQQKGRERLCGGDGRVLRLSHGVVSATICHGLGAGWKKFSDMRQEREIKSIRVGDAVRRAGQLKGELS